MKEAKFVKRKKPNYKRAIVLILVLLGVLYLFSNLESILSLFLK